MGLRGMISAQTIPFLLFREHHHKFAVFGVLGASDLSKNQRLTYYSSRNQDEKWQPVVNTHMKHVLAILCMTLHTCPSRRAAHHTFLGPLFPGDKHHKGEIHFCGNALQHCHAPFDIANTTQRFLFPGLYCFRFIHDSHTAQMHPSTCQDLMCEQKNVFSFQPCSNDGTGQQWFT